MSKVILYMSMSLDGFITGPNDDVHNGLGINGGRLHAWLGPGGEGVEGFRPADATSATVFDEVMATGAVITGRRTFEHAGGWDGDHHDGVPIYVLTNSESKTPAPGHARYVTEGIESCVEQARTAAAGRDVMLHGAATAQSCLKAGLLDEMEIHLIPVLLGQGRRLFDDMPRDHVELELVRALEAPDVLHLRYRVRR